MNQFLSTIANIITISIPEEFFISFLMLYFVKIFRIYNHDFFDIQNNFKGNILRLMMVSVLPLSIISNLLIVANVNVNISGIIGIVLTALSIIIYLKIDIRKFKKIILIFVVCILSFVIFIVTEEITTLSVYYITKTTREFYTQSFGLKFLLSLFERVIQYAFVMFVLLNKNSIVKINIIKTVIKSRWLFIIFTSYIVINGIAFILFCQGILTNHILKDSNELYKIFWTLGMFILVSIDICSAWLIAMLVQIKEKYKYKYGKEARI